MPTRRSSTRSDAELSADIRNEDGADAAVDLLFRRHHPSVLAYARTCCRDSHTAEELAAEAFTRTLRTVRSGSGPTDAWRPYLLTTVRRTAAAWADTARRTDLAPGLQQRLDQAPAAASAEERMLRAEDTQLVLHAFQSLPERRQTALWHSAVEEEPASRIAELLGTGTGAIGSLATRAREGLREAYLTVYAERINDAGGHEECRRYTGLLAAAVRRTGRRTNKDLERHLADCPDCRSALLELTDLGSSLRSGLSAAVLFWGSDAYIARTTADADVTGADGASTGGGAGAGPANGAGGAAAKGVAGVGVSARTAGVVAVSLTAVTALTAGSILLFSDSGNEHPVRGASPSAAGTNGRGADEPLDRPTTKPPSRGTKPGRPAPSQTRPSETPSWSPAADARTRLRIKATDRCMDIGAEEGSSPYEADCNGDTSQHWDLLLDRAAQEARIRNLATGLCLTHTDSAEDGAPVRQRPCEAEDSKPYTRWAYFRESDHIAFAQRANQLNFLGLDDWQAASEGKPHKATIGTTANYNNTPSLRFRYDGQLGD